MVAQDGVKVRFSKRKTKLGRYWFYDGKLHTSLHINRGQDKIIAWCYPLHKRVAYTYSAVRKNHQRAFTTQQTAKMLNRKRNTIQIAIMRGHIPAPQLTYSFERPENHHRYLWREEDIITAQRFFASRHYGHPRADGGVSAKEIPSELELRALIRHNQVTYVKVGDDFVPTWQANEY